MTLCQRLASKYPELAADFVAREDVGMARYGRPLDPIADARDWRREAREELIDGLVYLLAEFERAQTEQDRVDIDAASEHVRVAIRRIS